MNNPPDPDVMKDIVSRFPGFTERWNQHTAFWNGKEAGLCNDFSEFAAYALSLLSENVRTDELVALFAHIETLVDTGPEAARTAACTCFLENIVNAIEPRAAFTQLFVSLLGPKSLQFCRAWAEFSGGGIAELTAVPSPPQ